MTRRRLTVFLALAILLSAAGAPQAAGARKCFSQAETLDAIAANGLVKPGEALSAAAAASKAEALNARLCQWDSRYIYEITLLRSDGKVLRVTVDAATGRPSGP